MSRIASGGSTGDTGLDDFHFSVIGAMADADSGMSAAGGRRTPQPASRRIADRVRMNWRNVAHGGWNRHHFFLELERALSAEGQEAARPALLLIGMHAMPRVQTSHGLPGLAALQDQWGGRLAGLGLRKWTQLREDTVAVLLPPTFFLGAQDIMRLLMATPYLLGKDAVPPEVSTALIHLRGTPGTLSSVLLQADQLLDVAMKAGFGSFREGYAGVPSAPRQEVRRQLPVEKLQVAYQPISTIDGLGSPVSVVLARMRDEHGELLPSSRFLPQIQREGMLPLLDAWALRHALTVLTEQERPLVLVVHASEQSLADSDYLMTVVALLENSSMPSESQCLVVAMPESAVISHRMAVGQLSKALARNGSGIMLTQYGSTASSVALVEEFFPLFVRLHDEVADRLRCNAETHDDKLLLETARLNNASCVAGNVENARSLSVLWSKGVRRFQGYFIQGPGASMHLDEALQG